MQIITYLNHHDEQHNKLHRKVEEKVGKYTDIPPNWRPITEEELARSTFFGESWLGIDYRQFKVDPNDKTISGVKLIIMHDMTGFGIVNNFWDRKVRYFRFGCEHKMKELSVQESNELGIPHYGRCYHNMKCTLCGIVKSYDSSD